MMGLTLLLVLVGVAAANDVCQFPNDLPPVIGTAVVGDDRPAAEEDEWTIRLTLRKVTWKIVGQVKPKQEWPAVAAEVEKQTRTLRMGGPYALAPSHVVELSGRELTREEVLRRLGTETPVLVSLSGRMIDKWYLQLTVP